MRQFEMTITLEETQFLCQTRRNSPLLAFHHRPCYQAVIASIVDSGLFESIKAFVDKSRDTPLLNIQALDKMMPNRAYYTGETWLKCFLLRFVGELFFGPGKPRVEMAVLAVVRAMIEHTVDISAIVLATVYQALDSCTKRSRHFMGCAALVQL
jgi:hypothetical protein